MAFERLEGFLTQNTVLERGLVIAPVIVAANTLNNALALGISFTVITLLTLLIASFVPKHLSYTIRVILYVITACIIFIPTAKVMNHLFTESIFKVGIFLPLLVTNSLIVTKSETRFLRKPRLMMLLDVFCHVIGFFMVIVLVGVIREILGNGTLMGNAINMPIHFAVLMLPFGGFITVGFLSALLQRIHLYLQQPVKQKKRHWATEVKEGEK